MITCWPGADGAHVEKQGRAWQGRARQRPIYRDGRPGGCRFRHTGDGMWRPCRFAGRPLGWTGRPAHLSGMLCRPSGVRRFLLPGCRRSAAPSRNLQLWGSTGVRRGNEIAGATDPLVQRMSCSACRSACPP